MSNELKCPICGEPTYIHYGNPRKDRLCKKHGIMEHNGEIELCTNCNAWHNANETCNCKKEQPNNTEEQEKTSIKINNIKCLICGNQSNGKPQCKDCYYETKDFIETLDKNTTTRKTRDYYYNLKERIFIIKSLEETQKQCNKLIAIAMVAETYNDDTSLIDRVYKDVESLIQSKQPPKENDKFEEDRKEKDEQKSKINTSIDGHNLDSDMEVRIDDILYNARIIHVYGKDIDEIIEKRKKCDWFIPILNDKGIYIEYWGMKTTEYLLGRKEKEELYKKYNIPYISIEQDDPKKDSQTFKSNLLRELRKLAIEHYGFMPEWKK